MRSLVDQLAEEEPSASIPLIVSALSSALGVDQLCVHLLGPAPGPDEPGVLTRRAAVGVPQPLLAVNEVLPMGAGGGLVGLAAEGQSVVVTEDVSRHPAWAGLRRAAEAAGVQSAWAMPIQDADGVLGVISAYAHAVGSPQPAALELVRALHQPGGRRDRPRAAARRGHAAQPHPRGDARACWRR